jgi:hypothetical protein
MNNTFETIKSFELLELFELFEFTHFLLVLAECGNAHSQGFGRMW